MRQAKAVDAAQPYGLTPPPAIKPFLDGRLPPAAPPFHGDWTAIVSFPNLRFTNALGLTFIPGTSKLVVWEREGRVYSFNNDQSVSTKELILDISDHCQGWDDSGLLGLAFHPGFQTNHFMFVYYTWVAPGTVTGSPTVRPPSFKKGAYHDRLSRFTLDETGAARPDSETVFVDQEASSLWHNGGGMFFHPRTGFLYYSDGDDQDAPTQIINQDLFSGIFRLDVDRRGGTISHPPPRQLKHGRTANYYIPNDNPFVGRPGVLEEFFALGLRNPHRMTLDQVSGRIFIGDVGGEAREEIDVIEPNDPAGLNFQWNKIEGLRGDLIPPFIGVNRRPILDYAHSDGQAVIGGYVYRGREFQAELGGKYIFGDNVQRKIWSLEETNGKVTKTLLCILPKGSGPSSGPDYTGLSSFGIDEKNELYLCQMSSEGGHIYKLGRSTKPADAPDFPPLLSQTGAFSDTLRLVPAEPLISYEVNTALWSDGANKSRWIAIPANAKISLSRTGEWAFPAGTVFVKHFDLPIDETDLSVVRRLETRFLIRDTNGAVFGATYKWKPDNSDADLLSDRFDEDISIRTSTGMRTQTWHYPSREECSRCHSPAAKGVLGINTRQMNRNHFYTQARTSDNQLRAWNHIRLFQEPIDETEIPRWPRLVAVTDKSAPLEMRARSYLDANCSHCHRPGGSPTTWDARFETPLSAAGILNGAAVQDLGIPGGRIVMPGDVHKSILYKRVNSDADIIRMPPLAKNVIDQSAVEVLAEWIRELKSNP